MFLKFILLLAVLSQYCALGAHCFSCYICDSKFNLYCTENLANQNDLQPRDCSNITGAAYCIKTTNMYAGEFGTKRFCASNDHGNYCKYVKQVNGDREYRSCVYTCDSENCNASMSLFSGKNFFYLATPLSIMVGISMTTCVYKIFYDF